MCNYSLTIVEPMIIEPPQNALQVVGRNVSFRCVAFGIPRPNITWMLTATDDTMMVLSGNSEVDGGVIRNELNLTNLTVQDFGVYSCIASNMFHDDMEMATLEQGSELFITTYYKRPSLLDVISHTNLFVRQPSFLDGWSACINMHVQSSSLMSLFRIVISVFKIIYIFIFD